MLKKDNLKEVLTLLNLEVVIDNLGEGSETVGGARGVGDNLHAGGIFVLVHAHHKHGGVSRGGGDYNLLGSTYKWI